MVASVFDYGAIKRRMMELTGEIPSGNHFDMQGNKIAAPSIPSAPEYPPDNLAATYKAIQSRINECDQRRVRELATDLYKPTPKPFEYSVTQEQWAKAFTIGPSAGSWTGTHGQ